MNAQLLAVVSGGEERRSRLLARAGALGRRGRRRAPRAARARASRARHRDLARHRDRPDLLPGRRRSTSTQVEYAPNPDREAGAAAICAARSRARCASSHDVRDDVGDRFGPDFAAVFNTHIQILEDKGLVRRLEDETRATRQRASRRSAAWSREYARMFAAIEDPYFRERGVDVEDVGQRVMAQLLGVRHHDQPLTDGRDRGRPRTSCPRTSRTLDDREDGGDRRRSTAARPRTARSSRARSRSRR